MSSPEFIRGTRESSKFKVQRSTFEVPHPDYAPFPAEERWSLTGQIRRSSRSVCLNLREVWAKRRYEAHFISKLSDCDGEANETDTALDFARDCGYITTADHENLSADNRSVGRMLGSMMKNPHGFLISDR